jgi:hypothetical protein
MDTRLVTVSLMNSMSNGLRYHITGGNTTWYARTPCHSYGPFLGPPLFRLYPNRLMLPSVHVQTEGVTFMTQ